MSSERRARGDAGLYDGAQPTLDGLPEGREHGLLRSKGGNLVALCKSVLEAGSPCYPARWQTGTRSVSLVVDKSKFWSFLRARKTPRRFQGTAEGYGSS